MGCSLSLALTVRHLPKLGLSAEQCEDAWAVNNSASRFAVADGATDSYASGRLARLMVEGFADESGPRSAGEFPPWARSRAEAWVKSTPVAGLPWYKQEKARLGAHCTFLGIQLESSGPLSDASGIAEPQRALVASRHVDGACGGEHSTSTPVAYRAFAVGDVCLFHVRDDRLLCAKPVERPEDFGVQPALVATSRSYPGPGIETLVEWTGEIAAGDLLVLASDAVAHWFLVAAGQGGRPWRCIVEASEDEFATLVARLRQENQMRNDDVTVVAVAAAPEPSAVDSSPTPVPERAPRRGRRNARRGLVRAAAISLGAGALLVAVALIRSPKTRGPFGVARAGW